MLLFTLIACSLLATYTIGSIVADEIDDDSTNKVDESDMEPGDGSDTPSGPHVGGGISIGELFDFGEQNTSGQEGSATYRDADFEVFLGTSASDSIVGTDGADRIVAASLREGEVNLNEMDSVLAGGGNDTIYVDSSDVVTSGGGEDIVYAVYKDNYINPITLTDFDPEQDRLVVQLSEDEFSEDEIELSLDEHSSSDGIDIFLNGDLIIAVEGVSTFDLDQVDILLVNQQVAFDVVAEQVVEDGQNVYDSVRVPIGLEFGSKGANDTAPLITGSVNADNIEARGVIAGGDGSDVLVGEGAEGNTIIGGAGDDILLTGVSEWGTTSSGSNSTYTILSGKGTYLDGGAGDDILWVGEDAVVRGGIGSDTITVFFKTGYPDSADAEPYRSTDSVAVILDFNPEEDQLIVGHVSGYGGLFWIRDSDVSVEIFEDGTMVKIFETDSIWLPGVTSLENADIIVTGQSSHLHAGDLLNSSTVFTAIQRELSASGAI